MEKYEWTVSPADDGQRLERYIKNQGVQLPYHLLQKLFRKGEVKVNGIKRKRDYRIKTNDNIRLYKPDQRSKNKDYEKNESAGREEVSKTIHNKDNMKRKSSPSQLQQHRLMELVNQINILENNDRYLVINKPYGIATQGGNNVKVSIDDLLPHIAPDDGLKLTHRLDKDTSGALLLAKGREHASHIGKQFQGRGMQKIYLALVPGKPEVGQGTIDLKLATTAMGQPGKASSDKVLVDPENGRKAVTHYEVLDRVSKTASLVALYPVTGRKHQIRAHLTAIGHPVLGDGKYGGEAAFIDGIDKQLHLHAYRLRCPALSLDVTAPLPDHIRTTLNFLGMEVDDELIEERINLLF